MLILCPYCGARDAQEFSYRGDANPVRPDPAAPDAAALFHDYVYLRDNPAGAHRELWYHGAGCRRWVEVDRDTLTHVIEATRFAGPGRRA
jgi:methylglutamate dehydrogenase subunit B